VPELRFQTGKKYSERQAARLLGVSPQLLAYWRSRKYVAPRKRRRGSRTFMVYREHDIVCGIFLQGLLEDVKFDGDDAVEIMRVAHGGSEEQLKNALILTARTKPHLMRHVFISDKTLAPTNIQQLIDVEGEFANSDEMIGYLKTVGRYISHASIWDCLEGIRRGMAEKAGEIALTKATNEAGNEAC